MPAYRMFVNGVFSGSTEEEAIAYLNHYDVYGLAAIPAELVTDAVEKLVCSRLEKMPLLIANILKPTLRMQRTVLQKLHRAYQDGQLEHQCYQPLTASIYVEHLLNQGQLPPASNECVQLLVEYRHKFDATVVDEIKPGLAFLISAGASEEEAMAYLAAPLTNADNETLPDNLDL